MTDESPSTQIEESRFWEARETASEGASEVAVNDSCSALLSSAATDPQLLLFSSGELLSDEETAVLAATDVSLVVGLVCDVLLVESYGQIQYRWYTK